MRESSDLAAGRMELPLAEMGTVPSVPFPGRGQEFSLGHFKF